MTDTTTTTTTTGQLNHRVASELLAEAEAVRLRLEWLLRDTTAALKAAGCPAPLLGQMAETSSYARASLASIVLTVKEGSQL